MALSLDIQKNFGSFRLEASFRAEGGLHGLLGASGCGKSMTLKCIAGLVRPDAGHIELDGAVLFDSAAGIDLPPQRRGVGLLFQNYALFPHMTVEENLLAPLHRERDRAAARVRCAELVRRLSLEGLTSLRPAQLSGGQQQRAALARILLTRPRLLMLDEPFSALDSYLRWQIELELSELLEDFGGATLFVSHNREEVYRLCSTVSVLNRGKTEPETTVEQLFRRPQTLSAGLLSGCKNISRIRKTGLTSLFAEDWGVPLTTSVPIPDDAAFTGVRAHFVRPVDAPGENTIPANPVRVIHSMFSVTLIVNTPGGSTSPHRLQLELPTEEWEALGLRELYYLRIEPHDLMLLRA